MRVLGVFLLAALLAPSARAEDLDAETRRAAEHAFFQGRLQDLDAILEHAAGERDRLPLTVRDRWWRGPVAPDVPAGQAALEVLLAADGGGGGARWPLLRALVADRLRREHRGAAGLPEDGPLEAYWLAHEGEMDEQEAWAFRTAFDMMVRCYRGDDDPRETQALDDEARDLRNKNHLLWLGALGAFAAACFIGILVVGRRVGA